MKTFSSFRPRVPDRAHSEAENIECVGEEVARRIAMYQHDCRDKNMLTHIGRDQPAARKYG